MNDLKMYAPSTTKLTELTELMNITELYSKDIYEIWIG